MTSHPDEAYLQGKSTELATFSMARFRMEPSGPRQVGQQVSLGRQLEQTCGGGGTTAKNQFGFISSVLGRGDEWTRHEMTYQVSGLALQDRWQHIVETDRTLK